jgi:hypothetical protein
MMVATLPPNEALQLTSARRKHCGCALGETLVHSGW